MSKFIAELSDGNLILTAETITESDETTGIIVKISRIEDGRVFDSLLLHKTDSSKDASLWLKHVLDRFVLFERSRVAFIEKVLVVLKGKQPIKLTCIPGT